VSSSEFQEALLGWYQANARSMPWRVPPGSASLSAPIASGSGVSVTSGAPIPSGSGNAEPPIDALSELASGRVAEGREGLSTTELGYTPHELPTLKGSGHPTFKNPEQRVYEVWVSEIMLQQTTVATVTPYYTKWLIRFPTIKLLAEASLDDVLAHWQGLGYYRRARMLHEGARWVIQNGIPQTAKEWLAVPGVGRYTAGAIASIAQNEPAPLVDGNVERVVSRLTANQASAKSLTDAAWKWAESQLLPGHPAQASPGDWNQALMELGATVCKPVNLLCRACPVQPWCQAFAESRVADYPAPKPRAEKKSLHHSVVILTHDGKFAIRPVPEGRWWAGLYEFPREASLEGLNLMTEATLSQFGQFNHVVTNHEITVDLYHAEAATPTQDLIWVTEEELTQYALPAPSQKALTLWKKSRAQKTLWEQETSPD